MSLKYEPASEPQTLPYVEESTASTSSSSLPLTFISHKVFLTSVYNSQFPHRSVNLFFISVIVKDQLTDLWGSWLLHNDSRNTLCEIDLLRVLGFGFRVTCTGFRVPGIVFRVSDFVFRAQGSVFQVSSLRFRVPCVEFPVPGSVSRISLNIEPGTWLGSMCLGFQVSGYMFRIPRII